MQIATDDTETAIVTNNRVHFRAAQIGAQARAGTRAGATTRRPAGFGRPTRAQEAIANAWRGNGGTSRWRHGD